MSETIISILTNLDARKATAVESSLQRELSAGIPWYNEQN
jgi:hypothetical protein